MAVRNRTPSFVSALDSADVNEKPDYYRAIGTGGVRMAGGYVGADFLPQLQGKAGMRVYRQMADNDPLLAAVIYAISMLTRQVSWRVEPKSTDEADVVAAKWLEQELFEKIRTPWSQVMADAATMFVYGFAPCEITLTKRKEGWIGVDRIALRSQETIQRWVYDEETREAAGFYQQADDTPQVYIPIVKCLHFRTESTRGNPEGKSILRGSYVTWVRKRAIEEAEGRAALRSAGLVIVRVPGKIMGPQASGEDKATLSAMQMLAERVADDRQGSIILPMDMDKAGGGIRQFDIEYKMADGRRPADMSPIIERMDKRMAGSVLADFILLGQQAVGSFALSSDKTALFSSALGAFLDVIEGEINRALLPLLWRVNGFDEDRMPKVKHADIEKRNLAELATYVSTLAASGAQLFPDDELEKFLRNEGGLPEKALQDGLGGDSFSPPEGMEHDASRERDERDQPRIEADEQSGLKT